MSLETTVISTLHGDIARLQPILDRYGLWALLVACLAEGIGVPLPGQTLLIACALLAANGSLDLAQVLLVAWLGTQLGDVVGYSIGRYGIQRALDKTVKHRDRLARLERLFNRWGAALLVFARFVDGLRQTSNLAAGALLMSWWRFLAATLAGTSLWVGAYGVGAYLLKRDFHRIVDFIEPLKPYAHALTALLLIGLLWYLFGRGRRPD